MRLTTPDLVEALASEHDVVHSYRTSGDVLDLATWGEGWCFGRFDRREPAWCARAWERYGR
jgi:hypothetical protein